MAVLYYQYITTYSINNTTNATNNRCYPLTFISPPIYGGDLPMDQKTEENGRVATGILT